MFVKCALQYAKNNLLVLILCTIFPCFFWGFYTNGSNIFTFILHYYGTPIGDLQDITSYVMNLSIFRNAYPSIIFVVLSVVMFSVTVSAVEKHMKVGKFSLKNPLQSINSSLASMLPFFVLVFGFVILWEFLLSCLLLLNHYLFAGARQPAGAMAVVVAFILIILFLMILVYLLMYVLFIVPTRLTLGYSFIDSISYGANLIEGKGMRVYLSCLLPFILFFVPDVVYMIAGVPAHFVVGLVNTLVFMLAIIYFICLAMTGFFTLSGIARKDIRHKYYDFGK